MLDRKVLSQLGSVVLSKLGTHSDMQLNTQSDVVLSLLIVCLPLSVRVWRQMEDATLLREAILQPDPHLSDR